MKGNSILLKGDYKTWQEAAALSAGYDAKLIFEKVRKSTLKVKKGDAAYERDSVLFDEIQYSWPVTAALMLAAARNNGELHVLDFGGALGSSYFQNQKFISRLHEVSWSVVEQSHFVELGRDEIADGCLNFFSSINQIITPKKINVALVSGVLQYLSSPFDTIEEIAKIGPQYLVIDRTPFAVDGIKKIKIQNVPPDIYSASYPCHFFNSNEFIQNLAFLKYQLVENFEALDKLSNEAKWQGFIFERVR